MALLDLKSMSSDAQRKKAIKSKIREVVMKALIEEFGEENVVYINYAINVNDSGKILAESIAVRTGEVIDKDGFPVDAVSVISTQNKSWNSTPTKSGKIIESVNLDDIKDALEIETAVHERQKSNGGKK